MFVSSGNKHFFTKLCHCQTYQNYEQPPQTSQNSDFQSHFSVSKIGLIFQIFLKNIGLEDHLLLKMFMKILIFIICSKNVCPIFVGSIHDFGKSVGELI
jgi:hypothetical protein